MSDTPHPDPLDEQASDLFDAGADAPGDQPELGARLDEFRALRDALADVPPAPDPQRTGAIAAALALFDELAVEAAPDTEVTAVTAAGGAAAIEPAGDDAGNEPAGDEPAVVTPLRPAAAPASGAGAGASSRHRRRLAFLGAAASIVVALGVVALVTRDRGLSEVDSASSGVLDGGGGFSQAKAADDNAPAAESAAGDRATAGGSDTTAAAPAPVAAASSTSVRAATSVAAATTTAAASGGFTSPAAAEPTSTTDGRDVTTTTGTDAVGTTSPPTTTSTSVDAGALPYLGELTKVDDLAAALRTLPPFDGTDAGAPIRAQLASGVCDLRPYGTPVAVLRWNGRDSVLLRSDDAPIVQLIPLDGCNPIVQLDAPS